MLTTWRLFPYITIIAFGLMLAGIRAAASQDDDRYPPRFSSVSLAASRAVQSNASPRLHRQRAKRVKVYYAKKKYRSPVRTVIEPREPVKLPKVKGDKTPRFALAGDIISMSVEPITPTPIRTFAYAAEPRRVYPPEIVQPREPVTFTPREIPYLHSTSGKAVIAGFSIFTLAGLFLALVLGIDLRKLNPEATNAKRTSSSRIHACYRRCREAVANIRRGIERTAWRTRAQRPQWLYVRGPRHWARRVGWHRQMC